MMSIAINVAVDKNVHIDWHSTSVEETIRILGVAAETGLTDQDVTERKEKYGRNELTPQKKIGFLRRLFLQINNVLIYILLIAAIVSGALGEWAEVGLIVGVVVVNVTIGMIQEGKAEKATDAIKSMLSPKAVVVRNGGQQEIAGADLVPGDVVLIKTGRLIPADLRILECSNLKVLEAMLTGESNAVGKTSATITGGQDVALGDRKNLAFSATMVQGGQGKGVVIFTGDTTEIGKIGSMVGKQESMKTNLTVQLEIFGRYISAIVILIAVVTFCLAYFTADESASDAFNSAIAIAVAIIPEGLPAVVTISLALAMVILTRQNAIVKQLPAIETLGSISVICSDKTGTLTKNEMTVQKVQTASAQYHVQGVGYSPVGGDLVQPDGTSVPDDLRARLRSMFEGIVLCNDAGLQVTVGPDQQAHYTAVGYPTEAALLTLGIKLGIRDIQAFRDSRPRLGIVPFASEHKFMCCVHAEQDGRGVVLHVKGSPDRIFERCKDQAAGDDPSRSEPFDSELWERSVVALSSRGLRCLAVAFAPWDVNSDVGNLDQTENMSADIVLQAPEPFLTLVGVVAILDPPREEAIVACGVAQTAGIQVKMITGDHPATASAIAVQLGIVPATMPMQNIISLTGPQLDRMSDAQLDAVVMQCNIFARASPENKIKIVKSLQRIGQTCSMTGDGVNDAPALKAANIGVAMGITGTDVSKEAAKMILTDDNFATIVVAVREGRRVWDNLVKILLYNMPVNFAQGFSVFMAYVFSLETVPLTAIQVLYINMITSVTMGLMLAMEPAETSIMERPPRRKGKRLFGRMVMWHCVFVAVLIVASVLLNFQWELNRHETPDAGMKQERSQQHTSQAITSRVLKARACAFNMLVFGEIAYAINCRFLRESSISMKTLRDNKWCWIAITITVLLQIFLTYTPYVNTFFSNEGIDGIAWGRILAFSVAIFLIVEAEKVYGIRCIMPVLRWVGACRPTERVHELVMTDEELNSFIFLATSASTIGVPVAQR